MCMKCQALLSAFSESISECFLLKTFTNLSSSNLILLLFFQAVSLLRSGGSAVDVVALAVEVLEVIHV